MKYQDIINSHIKYGISKDSIIENRGYKDILENVVIAPWWGHDMFNGKFDKIDKINDKVYNIYGSGFSFSFIELKRIGAGDGASRYLNYDFKDEFGLKEYPSENITNKLIRILDSKKNIVL